jgi:type I restriction enzyme, R subunit
MERLLEEAELDEAQERKLEREFAREYHLITRDDRLEKIAEDIVLHFMGRGFQGKAMVISHRQGHRRAHVRQGAEGYWNYAAGFCGAELETCDEGGPPELERRIASCKRPTWRWSSPRGRTRSPRCATRGWTSCPTASAWSRRTWTPSSRPRRPLPLVFVCAMWMTGFDVPSCSTIYLDKPMRNHTLMQTIARANRVFREKVNGLIVDYVGVFRNLQKALAIYGSNRLRNPEKAVREEPQAYRGREIARQHPRQAIANGAPEQDPHGLLPEVPAAHR